VESLGEALAGVSLGSQTSSSEYGSSAVASVPFDLAPGAKKEGDGWGNFPGHNDGKGAEETHTRNESLELFLSQSPSQTLGEDVFRFSSNNLPALAEEKSGDDEAFRMQAKSLALAAPNQSGFGEIRSQDNTRHSPTCSVTGTTTSSRSVSPYANNSDVSGSRTIPAYQHKYDSSSGEGAPRNQSSYSVEDDKSSSGYNSVSHGHGSHPSLNTLESRSPYAKDRNQMNRNVAPTSPYDQAYDRGQQLDQSPAQPQMPVTGNAQPQQQVLYMAVPSPDGRGQILQPVQMMPLPGKPYTYVVQSNGSLQGAPSTMPDGSQTMMVLPPMNLQNVPDYSSPMASNVPEDVRSRMAQYEEAPNYDAREDYSHKTQYQTDPEIASLYSAPQRPPLDALLGQVRRLSRDQVGCRLVQQALDEEGPMAATLILNEGLPFWGEAMVDPFGNYLFQKILEKITAEERVMLVKSVSTRLVNASLNLHGTRSVQKIVELCAIDEQEAKNKGPLEESAASVLTQSLAPAAARLCIDSHGNHVIQRILLRLGPDHAQFIFDAVAASVGDVARHRHGCCVIQRCLDSHPSPARAHLVRRIVEKSLELMQDAYGNYVVQYVLDVCSDEDVAAVCESVVGKVNLLAIQKFSSNVMEKCLERCSDQVKELYLREMSDPERIRELMMDPFGNYVVQRALSVATHAQAIRLVEAMRPHLIATQTGGPNGLRNGGVRNTAGGRRIIAKICRRFPNFTLNPVGTQDELYTQNKGNHRYLNHHQQQGHTHTHVPKQAPVLAAYAPIGAPLQHYAADPRLAQAPGHLSVQQQPPHYGGIGDTYYDPFANGHGGYAGM
jgi:hypothetical protein